MKRLLLPTALFLALGALLRAEPLKAGDAAPVVTATADDGKPLNLGDVYKKSKYTLVYFYPKAYTGGCTAQGCSLRDDYDELTKRGVSIVGVSTDKVEDQKGFKELNHFQFPLLADTDKVVIKAFGQSGANFASREAYLIKDGKVVYHDTGVTAKQGENILNFLSREAGAPAPAAKPADAKPAAPAAPAAK
jgi:peroxiredoxin Q/BCP